MGASSSPVGGDSSDPPVHAVVNEAPSPSAVASETTDHPGAESKEAAPARSDDPAPQASPSATGVARPSSEPSRAPTPRWARAALYVGAGLALLGVAEIPFLLAKQHHSLATRAPDPRPSSSVATSTVAAPPESASADAGPQALGIAPFRIALLELDPAFELTQEKVGKRTCEVALAALGVSRPVTLRIMEALRRTGRIACHESDRLIVAFNKEPKRFRALELESAPGQFLRIREGGLPLPATVSNGERLGPVSETAGGRASLPIEEDAGATHELLVEEVSLPVRHQHQGKAFAIARDLGTAVADAGLESSVIEALDEALSARSDLPPLRKGATVRLIADAIYVADRFDRFNEVVAFEVRERPEATPIRLYQMAESSRGVSRAGGFFDALGHQPLRGRFRLPIAFPRITSRFNPHRMHPILHAIMPHNGCDFAAAPGTPVYAVAAGTVSFQGDAGPSGNLVTIAHEGGIETGYAHLSRFAQGVGPGTHVDAHALVGYVGTTGRSTGPHLHLSARKNGAFIDPLSLKLDAVRVVPRNERAKFTQRKEELDRELDAIPLPTAMPAGDDPSPSASTEPVGEERTE
ncbi:MAG: hypothetical protein NVS3B20_06350 [Polyangiales bacterium]